MEDMKATTSTRLKSFISSFLKSPFDALDNLDLKIFRFQLNIFKDEKKLREALIIPFFVIPALMWMLLGSDSTVDQATIVLINLPKYLFGQMTFDEVVGSYQHWYGLGTHWSAAVIYALLFYGISKHLSDIGIKKSQNVAITVAFVGFTISSFEFFWQISYSLCQQQGWIVSLEYPQLRILLQDLMMFIPAVIIMMGMNYKEYGFNIDKTTLVLAVSTIGICYLWLNYGLYFPVERLTVYVQGFGNWTSSIHFPQTMYTVKMDATSSKTIGELFYVHDDAIHLVNNVAKIVMSLTLYKFFQIKRVKR